MCRKRDRERLPQESGTGGSRTQAANPEMRYRLLGRDPVYPEGIAAHGSDYYVTSAHDGDIYRGDLAEPTAKPFIHSPGLGSLGIKATSSRLVVVQGDEHSGGVTVFERLTGDRVARFSNGAESGAVNDVAIAPDGDAYVTDSATRSSTGSSRRPATAPGRGTGAAGLPVVQGLHYEQRVAKLEMADDYAEGRRLGTAPRTRSSRSRRRQRSPAGTFSSSTASSRSRAVASRPGR
jgi:hypothetical protein